jgi:hypothetical protein
VEKLCYKKRDDIEEKVKRLEQNVSSEQQPSDNFPFQVGTLQALLSHSMQNEWLVDSGCTHHMAKDASLFTWVDQAKERKIYVVDDFSLDLVGHGDVTYQHGKIFYVYHVPNLSATLFSIAQLIPTCKIVEF